jgi:hypothetical protein
VYRIRLSMRRVMLLRAEDRPSLPWRATKGVIAAANLLKGNHQKPDYLGIPTVVFTIPSLTAVGLSESEAGKKALKFKVKKEMTSNWYSSRRAGKNIPGSRFWSRKARIAFWGHTCSAARRKKSSTSSRWPCGPGCASPISTYVVCLSDARIRCVVHALEISK